MMTMRPALRPPMLSPMRAPLNPIKGGGGIITSIFADGTDGFYFDGSKTDRTWQVYNAAIAADDPGEVIGLAYESSKWNGRSLDAELAALTNKITNGDNESALLTSAYGSVGGTSGTISQSADFAYGGTYSAKYLCNTAASAAHYFNVGLIPANTAIYIRGKVYVPTGSITTFKAVDINDGSWIPSLTTTKDQWVSFVAVRAANATAWNLSFGENNAQSINGQAFYIDELEIYAVPGNHGVQTTSAARPIRQTGGLSRFDGVDDNWLTTKIAGSTGFIMARCKPTSGAATQILAGAVGAGGTDRIYLGVDASNQAVCRIGNGAALAGSVSIAGVDGTIGVRWNGTTVDLLVNGVVVNTQSQTGAPTTTIALRIGGYNNNGTAANFFTGDVWDVIEADKALTDGAALAIHAQLMAA